MADHADIFFENGPVFKPANGAVNGIARFEGREVLQSGWAWGQQYLDGGTVIADAKIGEGKVVLFGAEVAFRGQPHGTFKLLFNALYYGAAKTATLR